MTRFCKDCRYILDADRVAFAKCGAEPATVNVVTGESKHPYCSDARTVSWGKCGPDGKLWQPITVEVTA